MKKWGIGILTASILFASCEDGLMGDPQINNLTILEDSIMVEPAALLQFTAEYSDDNGLAQYKVRIEDDFVEGRLANSLWGFEEVYDLSGTTYEENFPLEVPYNDVESGRYRLDVILQDVDGNETSESRHFYLYH